LGYWDVKKIPVVNTFWGVGKGAAGNTVYTGNDIIDIPHARNPLLVPTGILLTLSLQNTII
jgi:hypothetical protein